MKGIEWFIFAVIGLCVVGYVHHVNELDDREIRAEIESRQARKVKGKRPVPILAYVGNDIDG